MTHTNWKSKKWIYSPKPDKGYENWSNYAYGYRQAVRILIEKLEESESPIGYKDLCFPIFFLYRHFTELLLKEILKEYYVFKRLDKIVPNTHDLIFLWSKVKPIITELFFDEKAGYLLKNRTNFIKQDIRQLNSQIKKLNQFDSDSSSFRYPVDKNGNQSIKVDIEEPLDLFKSNIENTYSSLSFVPSMIFLLKNNV
jgi:hypothetical protein